MNRLHVRVHRVSTCLLLHVLTGLLICTICTEILAAGDILDEVILNDIFSTQLDSMATQCDPATSSDFSFEFDFDAVDHTGKNWADDSTGTYNAVDYERDNFLVSLHHEDANPNRTWTAGISTAGNIYSFRGAFGEASPPQTNWHPDDKGSLWVDDLVQMGVLADTRTDNSPSGICFNHPDQTSTSTLNYNIECTCQDANGVAVDCSAAGASVDQPKRRLVNNFAHQGGVYSRDTDEDANGNPYLFKTKNGALTGKPFFSPNIAAHCEGNTCAFGTWGQQAHTPTPWRSAVLYFSRFADCGDGVLEFSQTIYNDGDSAGTLGSEVYNYGNSPWGGVRSSTLPKLLVSSKDHALDFSDDQVEILPWGTAFCEGRNGDCNSKLCMDVSCTAGFTTFTQDIPPPPVPYPKVCINPTTGSVSRSTNCTSGQDEFNPVMYNNNPCGPGYARPTRARCNVQFPQGDHTAATAEAVSKVNAIKCQNCRLIISVTRPGVVDPIAITEFVITNLDHFTYTDGDNYANHFIYFDPLALAGNAGDESNAAVTAWTTALNARLVAGDVFNLSYDMDGGVDTDDALALTFIHGRDTTANGGVNWERNRAGISQRDFTVWTVNPIGISLGPQDTYGKQMYFSTDELTNVESTAEKWVNKTDEEFVDDPSQFNGRAIQLYSGSNGRFGAVAADVPLGTSTSCPSKGTPACSGWSTPKSGHKALFYISCGSNTYVTADQYHFSPPQTTFGDDLNYADDDPIRSYVCRDLPTDRPSWKLLGFFVEGGCASLANSTYDSTLCTETSSPSSEPSEHPSTAPSQSPTATVSSAPSETASSTPSVAASHPPSMERSEQPTVEESSSPSETASYTPSVTMSAAPSITESSAPSTTASLEPSLSASEPPTVEESASPSVTASNVPSVGPSEPPSITASDTPTAADSVAPSSATSQFSSSVPSNTPSAEATVSPSVSSSPSLRATAFPSQLPSEPIDCGSFRWKRMCKKNGCVWVKSPKGKKAKKRRSGSCQTPPSSPGLTVGSDSESTGACGTLAKVTCKASPKCLWKGNKCKDNIFV